MATGREVRTWRRNLQDEVDGAAQYRSLAAAETSPELAEVYRRLAASEDGHAAHWEAALREAGHDPGPRRPSWRPRLMGWLARRLGPGFVLATVAGQERTATRAYAADPAARAAGLPPAEASHARILDLIAGHVPAGVEGGALARLEGRHRAVGGNALRAAVLGANDGLCSNLSLVMGVAGAEVGSEALVVTGLAGLVAGAASMAMGEWLSVQSSRELYERQIAVERAEIRAAPESEAEELALIYRAKGLPEEEARSLARRLMADEATALDTLAREELGIDPAELGGSAGVAAATSFALFAVGAIVPVVPFLFLEGLAALATSLAVSAAALFGIGAGITLVTGRSAGYSGLRQLVIGVGAAGVTFAIGRLVGAAL